MQSRSKLTITVDSLRAATQHRTEQLGSDIYFPCPPYPQQLKIVETLHRSLRCSQNALIDSPTGTGKTLSLLVGALSFFAETGLPCKLYYLTRTHSQINQVAAELQRTCYNYRCCIITAKEGMCINSSLRQLKGRELDRCCETECRLNRCKFREWRDEIMLPPLDIPHVREAGRERGFCPFYHQRKAEPFSEVVLMPYNYLFDLEMLKSNRFDIGGAVVLIDEAHNIDQQAQEGCSFGLNEWEVRDALKQLHGLERNPRNKHNFEQFRRPLTSLQASLKGLPEGVTHLDSFEDLFQILMQMTRDDSCYDKFACGFTRDNLVGYLQLGEKILRLLPQSSACDTYINFLRKCLAAVMEESPRNFSITTQRNSDRTALNVSCLTASLIFKHLASMRPRSIVLASGTLQPLNYWPQETSLQFPHMVSNESFIEARHAYSVVLSGYRGQDFDFSYGRRSNSHQIECLLDAINLIGKNTPNGVVVSFSSYDIYDMVMAALPTEGLCKPMFKESREGTAESVLAGYGKACLTAQGAFLFIVMRGKLSEGVDFKDELCRAMMVVGVPFPPQSVELLDKQRYIDGLDGRIHSREWYVMQGMKPVNQAIGRVVRHPGDYGGVFLLDRRYAARQQLKSYLPAWFTRVEVPEFNVLAYRAFFANRRGEKLEEEKQDVVKKPKKRLLLMMEEPTTNDKMETIRKPIEPVIAEETAMTMQRKLPHIEDLL